MDRIYVRGSDDRINTDNQLADLLKAAPDGKVYADIMSGSKKRPQLEQLIVDAQPGDVVWIWSLDRLTREGILATLEYLKNLTVKRARVRSCKEPWLDSENPCYEIMVSCMAFAAKMERDRLIARTTTAIKRVREARGNPVIDKAAIIAAEGTLGEIAEKFGCSRPYVWRIRKEAGK